MPSRPVPPATRLGRHAAPTAQRSRPVGPPRAASACHPRRRRVPPPRLRVLAPAAACHAARVPPRGRSPRATPPARCCHPHRGGTPHRQPRPASARSPRGPTATVCKNCHPSDSFCTRYSDSVPASPRCARVPASAALASRRPRAAPGAPASPRPCAAPASRDPLVPPCSRVPPASPRPARVPAPSRVPASPRSRAGPRPRPAPSSPGGTRRELRRSAPAAGRRPRVGACCTSGACGLCLAGLRGPTIREYALG